MIQNSISKTKNQTKKPFKVPKNQKNITKEALNKKSFIKQTPPKVGIIIQNTILKFSKTKSETQKRPSKFKKNEKKYIRRPQIEKIY